MSLTMTTEVTTEEREAFLADEHVGNLGADDPREDTVDATTAVAIAVAVAVANRPSTIATSPGVR